MREKILYARSWVSLRLFMVVIMIGLAFATVEAQTYSVIHSFTGGDGYDPFAALVFDRAGNLYGTASAGALGYGTVFRLTRRNSSWILATLHAFAAGSDGVYPTSPLFIAQNGIMFGTTSAGGGLGNCFNDGCGTVFELRPPLRACASIQCPWTETLLYRFSGDSNGLYPTSALLADPAGNLYGESQGGTQNSGLVYELQPSGGNWILSPIYSFTGQNDGAQPGGGLAFDSTGNLYGTTDGGGAHAYGTVFQLSFSGSNWTEATLHSFTNGYSVSGMIFDAIGNLFGDSEYGGCCFSGTVFEMSLVGGSWIYNDIYDFSGGLQGPTNALVMDLQGNLYGTTFALGTHAKGNVFKLSRSGTGWVYSDLYDFTGGADGAYPAGGLVLDSLGNLYGTASGGGSTACGSFGCGVVFEINQ